MIAVNGMKIHARSWRHFGTQCVKWKCSRPILLDPCDHTMLLRHVADQRAVLEML